MENNIIKLASEKNFNKNIYPVKSIKGKPLPEGSFFNDPSNPVFECTNGVFGEKEMMMMDILATCELHSSYNRNKDNVPDFSKMIPKMHNPRVQKASGSYISKKMLEVFVEKTRNSENDIIPAGFFDENINVFNSKDNKKKRMKIPRKMSFTDSSLKQEFPFLKKMSSLKIFELIKGLSECTFKMKYPIRFFDGKKYQNFEYNNFCCSSRLFRLVNCTGSKISKDNKILERFYEIHFDTFLGYFYMQNVLSCYTDLVPGHFYEMSSYAQLFYRLLILPYFGTVKNPISLEEIKARLVLKSENYMCRKVVGRILDELETNRFISDPKEIKDGRSYKYQYTKNKWKAIIEGV